MSNAINKFGFVCGTTYVPTKEMWNKKFYVYDKGQLVQGKFTEVRFFKFCDTSWDISKTATLANGNTKRIYPSTKLYASPKDFVEGMPILNVWRKVFPYNVQSAFCKLFPQIDREGKVWKFCKGSGKYGKAIFQVVSCKLGEDLKIIVDKDFYERVEKANGGHLYASLDECMTNQPIEVVEFDEEKDVYARIEDYIYRRFLTFMDVKDACEISEKIYYRVVQYIDEKTAENFNDDDIDIAILMVLKEVLGVDFKKSC